MSDYKKLRNRYLNDPIFHQMVKAIYNQLEIAQLSPSEIREAAMLACIEFEMLHAPTIIVYPGRIEKVKD